MAQLKKKIEVAEKTLDLYLTEGAKKEAITKEVAALSGTLVEKKRRLRRSLSRWAQPNALEPLRHTRGRGGHHVQRKRRIRIFSTKATPIIRVTMEDPP